MDIDDQNEPNAQTDNEDHVDESLLHQKSSYFKKKNSTGTNTLFLILSSVFLGVFAR